MFVAVSFLGLLCFVAAYKHRHQFARDWFESRGRDFLGGRTFEDDLHMTTVIGRMGVGAAALVFLYALADAIVSR